jgi:hypothetical protein
MTTNKLLPCPLCGAHRTSIDGDYLRCVVCGSVVNLNYTVKPDHPDTERELREKLAALAANWQSECDNRDSCSETGITFEQCAAELREILKKEQTK